MTLDELRTSTAAVLTLAQTRDLLADPEGNKPNPRTVRRACELGQLPAVHVGGRVYVVRERLLAMLTEDAA